MKPIRLAVATAALSLVAAPFAFAQGHAPVGTHGQAGQHGASSTHAHQPAAAASSDIAGRISQNPKLEARLQAMLPSGMTMEQAASGFRNQGQFIAALEASKNQGISFTDLKAQMTGDHPVSLGAAIRKLKPAPTTAANDQTDKATTTTSSKTSN